VRHASQHYGEGIRQNSERQQPENTGPTATLSTRQIRLARKQAHEHGQANRMTRFAVVFLFFLAILPAPSLCAAETINGRVVAVHDGDTITLLTPPHEQIKIRLAEIDAPDTTARLFGSPWASKT
jgi:hypothetical protein